jgi:hypothetical protein
MPSESTSLMQKAYGWLQEQAKHLIYITDEEEKRLRAKLEITFGLTPNKAQHMIENMILIGKIERRETKTDDIPIHPSAKIVDAREKKEKEDEDEVNHILTAKPK